MRLFCDRCLHTRAGGLDIACVAWRFYWGETRAKRVAKLRLAWGGKMRETACKDGLLFWKSVRWRTGRSDWIGTLGTSINRFGNIPRERDGSSCIDKIFAA